MFKNAKIGDRVWDYLDGWGTITDIRSNDEDRVFVTPRYDDYPIFVELDNGEEKEYTLMGKSEKNHLNPILFWNEIKIENKEKLNYLESELRKLKITQYIFAEDNCYICWNEYKKEIDLGWCSITHKPNTIYFTLKSIEKFLNNMKGIDITKEQFFKAYKNVFVRDIS